MSFDRDGTSADALTTDLYLDAILAGRTFRAGQPEGRGAGALPGALDPAIRGASDRLRHDLVRVHPSFRFEERLATRLAEAALEMRIPAAVGAEGRVVAFRLPSGRPASDHTGSGGRLGVGDLLADPASLDRRDLARPLLIGGALTSAALSLAGAAIVAWRRTRPGSPMSRAARAVRDARGAATISVGVPFGSRRLD
jgi:hypothetical protein